MTGWRTLGTKLLTLLPPPDGLLHHRRCRSTCDTLLGFAFTLPADIVQQVGRGINMLWLEAFFIARDILRKVEYTVDVLLVLYTVGYLWLHVFSEAIK